MKKILVNSSFKLDLSNFKRNSTFLVFSLFLGIGVLLGVICYKNILPLEDFSKELFLKHYEFHSKTSFLNLAGQTLLNILPLVVLSYIIGTSAVGCVLVPLIPLLLGFIYGIISGYVYDTQEIMGVVFNLLILLPPSIIAFLGLLLCCRESFGFSKLLAIMCVKGGKCFNLYIDFKNYCTRYLVLLILFLFYSLLDASLTLLFIRFFKF